RIKASRPELSILNPSFTRQTLLDTSTHQPVIASLPDTQARRIPGNRGIWVGIFCVLVEFTVLFSVYFIAKAHHPDAFRAGPDRLLTTAGVAITLLLLASGYCMVKAIEVIRVNRHRAAALWVLAAIVLGLGYPAVKFFEINYYIADGIVGRAGIFYGTYYYLTLNHLVHVGWGLMGLIFVAMRSAMGKYNAGNYSGLEAAAMYWHTTDILWLVIFQLFYVLR
ncbi:MAG TPA: cytochrome c oxidase subunit 3 family protein, partial [Gammaproteobacteria bacterium]|nr:cytochrome c oxidase subunit 3 family protein [Gammaproteobacteria bacterium]